jgi:hypothetical protein
VAKGVASMRQAIALALLLTGCSESATELTAWQKAMRDGSVDAVAATKAVETKTDEAIGILRENSTALAAIKAKVDALQVVSETPKGQEVIKSALESPAKANIQQAPLKVATPGTCSSRVASDGTRLRWNVEGNWNPTILETSAHLKADHGIDTNGMTHQQMADIHADLHDGKPVAMRAQPVQMVSRGSSCPGGVCPVPKRGLFRWRR